MHRARSRGLGAGAERDFVWPRQLLTELGDAAVRLCDGRPQGDGRQYRYECGERGDVASV